MRTHEKLSFASTSYIMFVVALLYLPAFATQVAAEPSATEIMAASKAAMSQPLKYRVIAHGVEMVVYQKTLPDGSIASVSDVSSPIKKTMIKYGGKSYDLFLDKGLAIDTKILYQGAMAQASSISSMLDGKAAESVRLVGTVKRDSKDCYEIESAVTPDVLAALAKAAPAIAANMLPAKTRYVIQQDTYLIVETETLSKDGSSLSKVEFKDIKLQPDLTDDFFQLPAGLKVIEPESVGEYMTIVTRMMSPAPEAVALVKTQPPPATSPGRPAIASPPIKPRQVAQKPTSTRPGGEMQPRASSTAWTVFIYGNVALIVIVIVIVFVLIRRNRSRVVG